LRAPLSARFALRFFVCTLYSRWFDASVVVAVRGLTACLDVTNQQ
jgi:hypothetical protein